MENILPLTFAVAVHLLSLNFFIFVFVAHGQASTMTTNTKNNKNFPIIFVFDGFFKLWKRKTNFLISVRFPGAGGGGGGGRF